MHIETIENFIDQYRVRVIDGVPSEADAQRLVGFSTYERRYPLPAEERRKLAQTSVKMDKN